MFHRLAIIVMFMGTRAEELTRIIWDYQHMGQVIRKMEGIFGLGTWDTRVAERSAQLYLDGYGDYIVFSGGVEICSGGRTVGLEAEYFAKIAQQMGVPPDKILVEDKATNTGENICFTHNLLRGRGRRPRSLILVHKPYMERRTYATFKQQWPDPNCDVVVTSPEVPFDEYCAPNQELRIHNLVGAMQRLLEYPKLGFQIEQAVPDNVREAYEELVGLGYNDRLIAAVR